MKSSSQTPRRTETSVSSMESLRHASSEAIAPKTFRYFAYGSNMSRRSLNHWAVEPLDSAPARLPNYEMSFDLVFPQAFPLVHGLATITPSPGSQVYGVFYHLRPGARLALDVCELVFLGMYMRRTVNIELYGGETSHAEVYVGRWAKLGGKPAAGYRARIVEGAREGGLPTEWITWLEGQE